MEFLKGNEKKFFLPYIFIIVFIAVVSISGCQNNYLTKEHPINNNNIDFEKIKVVDDFDVNKIELYIGKEFQIMGLFTADKVEECLIIDGCGPTYKLWTSDYISGYIPLFGFPIQNPDDDQKLIIVSGIVIKLTSSGQNSVNHIGSKIGLQVSSYKILNEVKYNGNLIDKGLDYISNKFGCTFDHEKTMEFFTKDHKIFFKIRFSIKEEKYIELWIDFISGKVVNEIDEIRDPSICE